MFHSLKWVQNNETQLAKLTTLKAEVSSHKHCTMQRHIQARWLTSQQIRFSGELLNTRKSTACQSVMLSPTHARAYEHKHGRTTGKQWGNRAGSKKILLCKHINRSFWLLQCISTDRKHTSSSVSLKPNYCRQGDKMNPWISSCPHAELLTIFIIIIMQQLTHHVSVTRMMNRKCDILCDSINGQVTLGLSVLQFCQKLLYIIVTA